jgi:hypothetical protein
MRQDAHKGLLSGLPTALALYVCVLAVCGAGVAASAEINQRRIDDVAAMLDKEPQGFGAPITDRKAWKKLAQKNSFREVIRQAQQLLEKPIPEQPDDLYLDFSRTGNRSRWQRVAGRRRGRVGTLALAECLENKGRFVDAFEQIVQELCAERTWVMPAHDRSLANFNGKTIDIDLGSSMLAWSLATADYLLADRLSPEVRRLIHKNLNDRIFEPYQDMVRRKRKKNWWMTGTNNWNAVCLGGVTGSALSVVESPRTRALFAVAAEEYSKNFLKGFTDDGYCSEGLGYWNYGFGYYIMLSEIIYQATNAKLDLLDNPKVRRIASFGVDIEIINGVYPAFADCSIDAKPGSRLMYFVSRRFGLGLRRWEQRDPVSANGSLYESMMYSFPNSASKSAPARASSTGPGIQTWFDDAGVLICRPEAGSSCQFGVALKGGHNQEHHNHNDVGSFVVVLKDKPLLLDPGSEVYTGRTFSGRRYESDVLNSFGHPVPVVAGKLQRTGRRARARVVRKSLTADTDTLVLDISSAYDVPELKKLERTFIYSRRGPGSLTVTDEVTFSEPCDFGTALVTFNQWKQAWGSSLFIGEGKDRLRVDIDVSGADFAIESQTIDEDVRAPKQPTRLGLNLAKPVRRAVVTIKITPMK